MQDRQTGRTTRQIKASPVHSIYIWPDSDTSYPKEIAESLNRNDIQFVSMGWLRMENLYGRRNTTIVIDHYFSDTFFVERLDNKQFRALGYIDNCTEFTVLRESDMNYEEAREDERWEKHQDLLKMLEKKEAQHVPKPTCMNCGVKLGEPHIKDDCNILSKDEINRLCGPSPAVSNGSALDVQVGGSHYKHFTIQPIEFITRNNLSFIQGCVIKRICRYNVPGGKGVEDLKKIIHELNCLIEIEDPK